MKAFIGRFIGFEYKEGVKKVQLLKKFLDLFLDPRVWMDKGSIDESRNKISAQNSIQIMIYHDFNFEKSLPLIEIVQSGISIHF